MAAYDRTGRYSAISASLRSGRADTQDGRWSEPLTDRKTQRLLQYALQDPRRALSLCKSWDVSSNEQCVFSHWRGDKEVARPLAGVSEPEPK